MDKSTKIEGTIEAWEERILGCDEDYVEKSSLINEIKLDEAIRLKTISIRLEEPLIEDFKIIAEKNGIKYQPLMKQVLRRFADAEMKNIIKGLRAEKMAKKVLVDDDLQPVAACG